MSYYQDMVTEWEWIEYYADKKEEEEEKLESK